MNSQTLEELQQYILRFCDERDWGQFHNPKDLSLSLSLEASELLEHFQWKNGSELVEYSIKNKESIGEEVADVLYWTLLIANKLDIDLTGAFLEKMRVNEKKYPVAKARGSHKKYTEL